MIPVSTLKQAGLTLAGIGAMIASTYVQQKQTEDMIEAKVREELDRREEKDEES